MNAARATQSYMLNNNYVFEDACMLCIVYHTSYTVENVVSILHAGHAARQHASIARMSHCDPVPTLAAVMSSAKMS